jgi:TPP-dependent indolepyruvate ferredoxin oxidoreductase alpha subunit
MKKTHAQDSLRILLGRGAAGQEPLSPAEWKCAKARTAWVRGAIASLKEAQRQMDERCSAAVDRVSEEEFNRIFDREQAKVSAILAQFDAVRERQEWPPEIVWGGV